MVALMDHLVELVGSELCEGDPNGQGVGGTSSSRGAVLEFWRCELSFPVTPPLVHVHNILFIIWIYIIIESYVMTCHDTFCPTLWGTFVDHVKQIQVKAEQVGSTMPQKLIPWKDLISAGRAGRNFQKIRAFLEDHQDTIEIKYVDLHFGDMLWLWHNRAIFHMTSSRAGFMGFTQMPFVAALGRCQSQDM